MYIRSKKMIAGIVSIHSVYLGYRAAGRIEGITLFDEVVYKNLLVTCNLPYAIKIEGFRRDLYFSITQNILDEIFLITNTMGMNIVRIGVLFGYPKCCIQFVQSNPEALINDEAIALGTLENSLPGKYPIYMNPRHPRLFFHTPCSLHCKNTIKIVLSNKNILLRLGLYDSFYNEPDHIYTPRGHFYFN